MFNRVVGGVGGCEKKTDSNMFFPPGVQAELMRRALEEIVGRL